MLGTPDGHVVDVIASPNVADSAKVYEIDPKVLAFIKKRDKAFGIKPGDALYLPPEDRVHIW